MGAGGRGRDHCSRRRCIRTVHCRRLGAAPLHPLATRGRRCRLRLHTALLERRGRARGTGSLRGALPERRALPVRARHARSGPRQPRGDPAPAGRTRRRGSDGASGAQRLARRSRDQRLLSNHSQPTRDGDAAAQCRAPGWRTSEQLLMGRVMNRASTSRRRLALWGWTASGLALLAITAAAAEAQTIVRDSGRVYRIQTRQLADSTYWTALRRARAQLKIRLDSLQHEFEYLSVESPDRMPRLREISALVSSLANLSDLEDAAREKA